MKAAAWVMAAALAGWSGAAVGAPWFICDSGERVLTVTRTAAGRVNVTVLDKRRPIAQATLPFTLGEADPGAGQVYYSLTGPGAGENANIHLTNPGMMEPQGSAWTPTISSMRLRGVDYSCRYAPFTRLQAVTPRRTLLITGQRGGDLTYRSANHSGGGRVVRRGVLTSNGPAQRMTFDNAGYRYVIDYSVGEGRSGKLTVLKAGKVVQTEPLLAFVTPSRR